MVEYLKNKYDWGKRVGLTLHVPRAYVEAPSSNYHRQELERLVRSFITQCVLVGVLQEIDLKIGGYISDRRELHEIPEVCSWARDTSRFMPSLWFFLDDESRQRFVGWLCGPFLPADLKSERFLARYRDVWQECGSDSTFAASAFLESTGANRELVSEFYRQKAERGLGKKREPKRWWQFWK